MSTEHVSDLLPLYALGALEPDEVARVEAHLPTCAACQAEAAEFTAVAGSLAAAVPARQPSPAVRAALLRRIAELGPRPASRIVSGLRRAPAPPQPAGRRARLWPAFNWPMAAMLAGLVGLLAWNVYLTNRISSLQQQVRAQSAAVALISSPLTRALPLRGQGPWATASGQAYVDPDSRSIVLIVQNLEPLDDNHVYQAWVITDAGPTSAGTVNVTRSGWGMSWLSAPYADQGWLCVSVEPEGGSEAPTQVILREAQDG